MRNSLERKRKKPVRKTASRKISQSKQRHLIGTVIIGVLVTGIVVGGGWAVYPEIWSWLVSSPAFSIQQVSLQGIESLNKEKVQASLPPLTGKNIFSVDLNRLSETINNHPAIKSASFHRSLPHRLVAVVETRKPVALVTDASGYTTDVEGALVPAAMYSDIVNLPLMTLPGNALQTTEQKLRLASTKRGLQLLDELSTRLPDLWGMISEISWDSCGQMIAFTSHTKASVNFGRDPDWAKALKFYSYMLYQGSRSNFNDITCIDLRFPEQVVVRRGKAEADSTESQPDLQASNLLR